MDKPVQQQYKELVIVVLVDKEEMIMDQILTEQMAVQQLLLLGINFNN